MSPNGGPRPGSAPPCTPAPSSKLGRRTGGRATSWDGSDSSLIDSQSSLVEHGSEILVPAMQAQLPQPAIQNAFRYGDENTEVSEQDWKTAIGSWKTNPMFEQENAQLFLPTFLEGVDSQDSAGLLHEPRCPLCIFGCQCFNGRPSQGLPRAILGRYISDQETVNPRDVNPFACGAEILFTDDGELLHSSSAGEEVCQAQAAFNAQVQALTQAGDTVLDSSAQTRTQEVPTVALDRTSASSDGLAAQKCKRSHRDHMSSNPSAKRPALNPSVQAHRRSRPAPESIRNLRPASPPAPRRLSYPASESVRNMMAAFPSAPRRPLNPASASVRRLMGASPSAMRRPPVRCPSLDSLSSGSSCSPKRKRPRNEQMLGEPFAKRLVRSYRPAPRAEVAKRSTFAHEVATFQPPNSSNPPVRRRRQLVADFGDQESEDLLPSSSSISHVNYRRRSTAALHDPELDEFLPSSSRNPPGRPRQRSTDAVTDPDPEPEEFSDVNQCRRCGFGDGEGRCNRFGEMICCSNDRFHGTDEQWYHFGCAGFDMNIYPPPADAWYCWKCQGEPGRIPDIDETYKQDTDDEADGHETEDEPDDEDISQGMIVRKKRENGFSATGTTPDQNASLAKGATSKQAARAPNQRWLPHEKAAVIALMHEIMGNANKISWSERRWEAVETLLQERYSIDRTGQAVKNWWSREGRRVSGLDERNIKKPDKLVTGVQDPADRKALRLKRKAAAKAKVEGAVKEESQDAEDDNEDEADQPTGKRQRRHF